MRPASEVRREATENHIRIQHEWRHHIEPIQESFIEAAIKEAVAKGRPEFREVVDWPLTERMKQRLLDLGYSVGERWRAELEDKYELVVNWAGPESLI